MNNNISYNCINEQSGYIPNLSSINGLKPSDPLDTKQNDFLFFRGTRFSNMDNNEENSDRKMINRLRNPFNTPVHSTGASNCRNNPQNKSKQVIEGFEAPLLDNINLMGDQIKEANRNMRIILETDSAMADFEREQMIAKKELDDKKYIAKQQQQDEKMESINKKMLDIEVLREQVMTEFQKLKGIQSQVSGKKLMVNVLDKNGHFQIKGNNKCLLYRDDGNYKFGHCHAPDNKQHFKMNLINNSNNYRVILNDSEANADINENKANYPFYVVQPINDNKQCLHAGSGDDAVNISIQPCQMNSSQKWNKVDTDMSCR
jgi:hypothetical protein